MVCHEKLMGKLVNLRAIEESDAEYTYRIRQDKEKTKYLHPVIGTVEDQRGWIKRSRESAAEYTFLVEDKQGNPLGMYSLYHIEKNNADSGRVLLYGNPMQNSEAAVLIHIFAFEKFGLESVHSNVFADNKPALGMTRKLGAKQVKCTYNEEFKMDEILFVIQKTDFEKSKIEIEKLIERFSKRNEMIQSCF